MSERDDFKLVTPEFRGSYVHLAQARGVDGGDEKFGINIVLPKDDEFWDTLDQLVDKCAEEKWGKIPQNLVSTIKDVDEGDTGPAEWEGCLSIPATNKDRPGIIDRFGDDILDVRRECYPGAWYRATVRVGAWFHEKSRRKGVSLYLDNVMKVRDDDAFGGQAAAPGEDFADYIDKGGNGSEETTSRRGSRRSSRRGSAGNKDDRSARRTRRARRTGSSGGSGVLDTD